MVYLGKQIKTSNMLQKRVEGVEEKRRRLGRLRRERSTLTAVSRGDRHHSYCDVWGVKSKRVVNKQNNDKDIER